MTPHETTHEVCAATGKRIYISQAKAWLCAGRIQKKNKRNGDRHAVHCYHCDACSHYHVGHVTEGHRKKARVSTQSQPHRIKGQMMEIAA